MKVRSTFFLAMRVSRKEQGSSENMLCLCSFPILDVCCLYKKIEEVTRLNIGKVFLNTKSGSSELLSLHITFVINFIYIE